MSVSNKSIVDIQPTTTPNTSESRSINCDIPSTSNNDLPLSQQTCYTPQSMFNVVEQEDVPPDGGYGWVITACLFLINAHTWGVNSAWAIFLAQYLDRSTFPGTTHLEYALIGGLSISMSMLIAPTVSIMTKHIGIRSTLLVGTALVFVALFVSSYATQVWHLFLSQGVCFGFGMGLLYITATAALPQWFSSRRSLALGIASSGAGLGGLAYTLIAGRTIETVGLAWTYRILALCTLVVNLACSLLMKDRNRSVQPVQAPFNYREYGQIEVILVVAWGVLTELGYVVLLYSLPNYAISVGLSHSQGAVVGAMLNLGLAVGRPVVGYYSDTFGRINTATVCTAVCGLLCLALWVPAKSYGLLVFFALLAGTCCGTFWGTAASVTTEVVGLKRLPSTFGLICLSMVIPTTFAEPIALQIVSARGYLASQIFVGGMFLCGAVSTWCLRSWKIFEIEQKATRERAVHERQQDELLGGFWLTPQRLFMKRRV